MNKYRINQVSFDRKIETILFLIIVLCAVYCNRSSMAKNFYCNTPENNYLKCTNVIKGECFQVTNYFRYSYNEQKK
jgi:hypothetical protein